jgi:hypothetical protein
MRGTSLVGSLVFSVMMSFWFLKVGRTSSPYPKSDFHRGGQRLRRASSSRLAGYGTPCGVGNCFKQLLAARSHTAADGCAKQASLSVPVAPGGACPKAGWVRIVGPTTLRFFRLLGNRPAMRIHFVSKRCSRVLERLSEVLRRPACQIARI